MSKENPDILDTTLQSKIEACERIIRSIGRVVVAFSGGVDSALLLAMAVKAVGAKNVLAAIGLSQSLPQSELAEARKLAKQLGAELFEITTHEMDDPAFTANAPDRCYHCKRGMFEQLKALAAERGFDAVVCGANADDAGDYRPGLQAGRELGVRNPLMEAGFTKADVRAASRAMRLPTHSKPAMACLASRIPYGDAITPMKLRQIEQAETVLHGLGFRQCRVRTHGDIARIEVPFADVALAASLAGQIAPALKALGYAYVTLDIEGFRSGSMNEVLADLK